MKRSLIAAVGLFSAFCIQPVFAQEVPAAAYTAETVLENMIRQADLGAARAICIGTKSECDAANPKPKGFDMLLTFDLDSAELLPEARANLEVVAVALRDDRLKSAKFRVEGHTDGRGSDDYNMTLSEARAKAVTDFLVEREVDRQRIIAIGLGETATLSEDSLDPENRRVELSLTVQ